MTNARMSGLDAALQNDTAAGLRRRDVLRFGTLGALGLAAAWPGRAQAQAKLDHVSIVGTLANTTATLQELMRQEGFFQSMGLDAEFVNVADGSKLMGALLSGSSDVCMISGFSQVLAAIEKGGKLKLVAAARYLVEDAIYTKKPEIKRLADLQDRTVGTGSPGALLHHMTVAALRKAGIDERKVQFVNIGSSADVFRAVVAGTVDAGIALADVYDHMDQYGVHALEDGVLWTSLPEYTYQASYTSDRAIAQKRDLLVRTLASYAKLYRFISATNSRDAFTRARAAVLKKSANEGEAEWNFIQKYKPYALDLMLSEERIRYMQELNVELGLQKKVLPYNQVVDMSLAQDAVKLLG